jgi:hypothetical protein
MFRITPAPMDDTEPCRMPAPTAAAADHPLPRFRLCQLADGGHPTTSSAVGTWRQRPHLRPHRGLTLDVA